MDLYRPRCRCIVDVVVYFMTDASFVFSKQTQATFVVSRVPFETKINFAFIIIKNDETPSTCCRRWVKRYTKYMPTDGNEEMWLRINPFQKILFG